MPKESRSTYQVNSLTIEELNFAFRLIADRLDELEGRRGTPSFKADVDMGSNKITTLGTGISASDATRKDQLDEDTTSLQSQITSHVGNTSNPHITTHSQLSDKGINDHAAIDTHIASTTNPHSTTLEQARNSGGNFSGAVQWLGGEGSVIHKFE